MTKQRSHMEGCHGITTQLILTGVLNVIDGMSTSPGASVLQGLDYIQVWLNQERAERLEGLPCTKHNHDLITTYHSTSGEWQITRELGRLTLRHPDRDVLTRAKRLLRGGDFSNNDETIIILCCATAS